MTTEAQVREAERLSKQKRYHFLVLLQVDDKRATEQEMDLFRQIKAAPDGDTLDKFLIRRSVIDLFRRRILFYGDAR
jgi:hypothetical protein